MSETSIRKGFCASQTSLDTSRHISLLTSLDTFCLIEASGCSTSTVKNSKFTKFRSNFSVIFLCQFGNFRYLCT